MEIRWGLVLGIVLVIATMVALFFVLISVIVRQLRRMQKRQEAMAEEKKRALKRKIELERASGQPPEQSVQGGDVIKGVFATAAVIAVIALFFSAVSGLWNGLVAIFGVAGAILFIILFLK